MPCSIELFSDEIKFLEGTAQHVLKENSPDGWYINQNGFAELDISKATVEQEKVLMRRLGGYKPIRINDKMLIDLNKILDL